MATDAAALGLALFAQWVAKRPPSPRASYGYARAEVLAAFVNALALLLLVGFIVFEAIARIATPAPVAGGTVLAIAAVGLAINLGTAWMLSRAEGSTSAHSALLHVLSDALGSVAAIVAGIVIITTGWTPIDPLLSLLTAVLILRSTWRLLAKTTGVLMEGVPAHLDYRAIGKALSGVSGVSSVHDLHVWHMVFSDSLNVPLAQRLFEYFRGRSQTAFGIGTNLTNDLGYEPLAIVIKMTRCNGQPVAKISDEPSKTMDYDPSYVAYLREVFQVPEVPADNKRADRATH